MCASKNSTILGGTYWEQLTLQIMSRSTSQSKSKNHAKPSKKKEEEKLWKRPCRSPCRRFMKKIESLGIGEKICNRSRRFPCHKSLANSVAQSRENRRKSCRWPRLKLMLCQMAKCLQLVVAQVSNHIENMRRTGFKSGRDPHKSSGIMDPRPHQRHSGNHSAGCYSQTQATAELYPSSTGSVVPIHIQHL